MAAPALPFTVAYTKTTDTNGSIRITFTITDANSNSYGGWTNTYASTASLEQVLSDMRTEIKNRINTATISLVPASGSLQYGFPAVVRPIDLY